IVNAPSALVRASPPAPFAASKKFSSHSPPGGFPSIRSVPVSLPIGLAGAADPPHPVRPTVRRPTQHHENQGRMDNSQATEDEGTEERRRPRTRRPASCRSASQGGGAFPYRCC